MGPTDGLNAEQAKASVTREMRRAVDHLRGLTPAGAGLAVVAEQVFPILFHAAARAGMTVAPKIMKEAFCSLQLASALGAAKQYGTGLWIRANLWGPDVGPWFTRLPGLPGHSPGEYESALKLGYLMGPTYLFTERSDVLLRFGADGSTTLTEFGETWRRFVREYVPRQPRTWSHRDVSPGTAIIWCDDSNYGQNGRLFGNRTLTPAESAGSISGSGIW